MSQNKLKIAFYWAASCGGCEIAVLDLNEKILDVVKLADIVFWPVAIDVKYKDVEALPDKHIDITFFNGSIRNSEQEHMAKVLRAKSKTLVAFGSCAHEGSVPGLANLNNKKEIFDQVYIKDKSNVNPQGTTPKTQTIVKEGTLKNAEFYDTVKTLAQTVEVDYYPSRLSTTSQTNRGGSRCNRKQQTATKRLSTCTTQSSMRRMPPKT